jgi:orotate phosphoribosyltransferase
MSHFFNGLFDDGGAKPAGFRRNFTRQPPVEDEERSGLSSGHIVPAYKGILLAAAVAIELARLGRNLAVCLQPQASYTTARRGSLVGAPPKARSDRLSMWMLSAARLRQ